MTEMSREIGVSSVFTSLPEAPRADSDAQLLEIWLHGRSRNIPNEPIGLMSRFSW